ncbi:MAG: DUF2585 family protein [Phycisphaeraceae bacterium]|nr:DUF2585 family protein [Phycisphaeraceae bacterium]
MAQLAPRSQDFDDAWRVPLAMSLVFVGVAIVGLRMMGRVWWCACGNPSPWVTDVWSMHCSQHFLDAYTFSHVSHGLLFFIAFRWLHGALPEHWQRAFTPTWWFLGAIALETGWEVLENTPFVIERYRAQTASLNYDGDSIGNSLGDILSCAFGFFIASKIGVRRTLILFVALEVVTLLWIRDNLTLNVVMLVHPIESIKAWQTPPNLH